MHISRALAAFFDLFYIGEGETVYDALFDAYKANKEAGGSREEFLLKQLRFREFMFRHFMMSHTKKTVQLHPLHQIVREFPRKSKSS